MYKQIKSALLLWSFFLIIIPSITFAGVSIDVDDETWVVPGESFTTDITLSLDDPNDTLSSFSFSLWFDMDELSSPNAISASPLEGWMDLGCTIAPPYIYNCSQLSMLGKAEGPLDTVVVSIEWIAVNPTTDNSWDIEPFFYQGDPLKGIMPDGAFDESGTPVDVTFNLGKVNVLPEPISSILFLTGGATFGLRRYWKKSKGAC